MRYLLLGLCVAVCMAQSPGNQFYALTALAGDPALVSRNVLVDAPLTVTKDATKYLHLGVTLPDPLQFESGFITTTSPGLPTQVFLDTSFVTYRSPIIPTGPGTCAIGTAGWSADSQFMFFCVPNPDPDGVPFIWGRVPVQTSW